MAELLETEDDIVTAREIFSQNFSNNHEEILAATENKRFKKYDYKGRLLFGLRTAVGNKEGLVAVALCMPRIIKGVRTLEVIWFSTDENTRRKGFGSKLFSSIMSYSKEHKFNAVLCTSTNKAASWWLSRPLFIPNISACKSVLRAENRIGINSVAFTDNPAENEKYLETIASVQEDLDISFHSLPNHRLFESLYQDSVLRNRRGKILKGQTFKGSPYRYSIDDSNHIWFLNDRNLVNALGTSVIRD